MAGARGGGGQNQVRLLMRELRGHDVRQRCLCPRGSALEARLRAASLPVIPVPWQGGLDPRALAAIALYTRGADVVHCHDAHALQLALLPALVRGVPIVASRRMVLPTSALKWNRAARVIAITNTVRDALRANGVRADKIRVIHSGIDPAEIAALPPLQPALRARIGVPADAFLVGSVGALVGLKGHALLAAAAAAVPDAHWVVIGEGSARPHIEAAAAAHGVQRTLHLPGSLPDARPALRELDLFVFTSTREALGTALLEAMACDIPVIAADAAGPAEVLAPVHAETGAALYPAEDAGALAALVTRVRHDGALRERMIAAQRRRLEDYRIENGAAATLALYREVVTG